MSRERKHSNACCLIESLDEEGDVAIEYHVESGSNETLEDCMAYANLHARKILRLGERSFGVRRCPEGK